VKDFIPSGKELLCKITRSFLPFGARGYKREMQKKKQHRKVNRQCSR